MIHGGAIFLFEVLVGVLIMTMIGAFLLKTSCALCNLLVGAWAKPYNSPVSCTSKSIPETGITTVPRAVLVLEDDGAEGRSIEMPPSVSKPSFEWAMCIVFAAAMVNLLAYFILVRVLRLAGMAAGFTELPSLPTQLVFYPLSFLIHSGMYAAMLPTSFGKGLLISLVYLFLSTLLAAVVFVLIFLIALAFSLSVPRLGLGA